VNAHLQAAKKAARLAGEFIVKSSSDLASLSIEEKSPNDFVSQVDRQSELMIKDCLSEYSKDIGFLGEEFGESANPEKGQQFSLIWVVDPLDGTTNFLRGIPHYSVSIALLDYSGLDPEVLVALVFDPIKNEMFAAIKGQGAYLNDEEITVATADGFSGVGEPGGGLSGGLIATGVPFSGENLLSLGAFQSTVADVLACQTSGIRRLGSAALDLAYVAAGRYDGYWESNLQIWDIAAGVLLVKEAGGLVTDFAGEQTCLTTGDVVAAPESVFKDLVSITEKNYSV